MARAAGSTAGAAKAALQTAAALESQPDAKAALDAGELSFAQARELVRTEAAVPGSTTDLLDVARTESFRTLRDRARDRRVRAIDPEELHARQHAAMSHRTWINANRADMVIVCDLQAYRRGHAHQAEACHILGGGAIPVSLAKELSRDAFLKAVLHTGTEIHTIAHFGRRYPTALRTALDLGAPPDFKGASAPTPPATTNSTSKSITSTRSPMAG